MKSTSSFIRILMLLMAIVLMFSSCNSNSEDNISKSKVVDMFLKYGEYEDGVYHFRTFNSTNGKTSISYFFTYYPQEDSFSVSALSLVYTDLYTLSDWGGVIFSWGDLENGEFSGSHEIDGVASVSMEFSVKEFKDNMSIYSYKYKVKENSFSEMTEKEESDYAEIMIEHINSGLDHARVVLASKCSGVVLK